MHVCPRWSPLRQRKHKWRRLAVSHLSWNLIALNFSQRQTPWCLLQTLHGRNPLFLGASGFCAFPNEEGYFVVLPVPLLLNDLVLAFIPQMFSEVTVWNSASWMTNSFKVSTDSQRPFSKTHRWYCASVDSFAFLHRDTYNFPFPVLQGGLRLSDSTPRCPASLQTSPCLLRYHGKRTGWTLTLLNEAPFFFSDRQISFQALFRCFVSCCRMF